MPYPTHPPPCSYFDSDTCHWLLREMEDNRDKSLALSKAYSYPDLRWVCQAVLLNQPHPLLPHLGVPRRSRLHCWLAQEPAHPASTSPHGPPAPAPVPRRSKLAAEGRGAPDVEAAQQLRRQKSSCQQHDHLGSPAFLEAVAVRPGAGRVMDWHAVC